MAEKYLNYSGLLRFWNGIKAKFAPLASPTFTGTPKAPTATSGTNTTQIATTAFVADAVSNVGGSSSGDMLKSNYATQSNTKVDCALNSEALGGVAASSFITAQTVETAVETDAMDADSLGGVPASGYVKTTDSIDAYTLGGIPSSGYVKTTDSINAASLGGDAASAFAKVSQIAGMLKTSDVVNNLTSTSTDAPLSAKQGKELKTYIDTKTSAIKNITLSTSDPTSSDGADGDIWIVYSTT